MKKFNVLFAGAVIATIAIFGLASTPNPVSNRGSNIWTNDTAIHPGATWVYTVDPTVVFEAQGLTAFDSGVWLYGPSSIDFKTSESTISDITFGGFLFQDTNGAARPIQFKGGLITADLMTRYALISSNQTSQLQPVATGTNIAVDFDVPVSIFTPTNNVFLIFSTNFSTAGSQDKLFKLKGSASNFTVKFGTDFTNLFGVYTTNGYILGNSNGPHLIAIHIDAAHGTETAAIVPPNN